MPFFFLLSSCKVHQCVDLGLPSGTLWATCNVGAQSPEQFGNYYAWGETRTKRAYTKENYRFKTRRQTLRRWNDVARRRWRGHWRMPTADEWQELIDSCSWRWLPMWGETGKVNGYIITGPNGQHIFIPAAGDIDGTTHYGIDTYGDYWSSSSSEEKPDQAQGMIFYSDGGIRVYTWERYAGHTVRPVRK